jgi:hypothetical protein
MCSKSEKKTLHVRQFALWSLFLSLIIFGVAVSICLSYWGYIFRPPPLDKNVNAIEKVTAVEYYHTAADVETVPTLAELTKRVTSSASPESRVLGSFLQRGVELPINVLRAPSQRRELLALTGLSEDLHHGVLFVGQNAKHDEVLVFSGCGFPLDHRTYTEIVFRKPVGDQSAQVVAVQRFNFDVAGLEYLTPPKVYLFATIGCVVVCGLLLLVFIVKGLGPLRINFTRGNWGQLLRAKF